jgi:hypothetical protein
MERGYHILQDESYEHRKVGRIGVIFPTTTMKLFLIFLFCMEPFLMLYRRSILIVYNPD